MSKYVRLPPVAPPQMAVVCSLALAPLLSLRNLALLAPMSSAAVVVAGCFVSAVVGLAGIAVFQGQMGTFHWLPTAAMLGPTPWRIAINLLAVLPVITMSFVCHYNLLPVANNLEHFTERRIMLVIRRALTICTGLFTAVAAGGVLLFGDDTKDNILLNLTPEAVSLYISEGAAVVVCFLIRLGYCLCLMVGAGAPPSATAAAKTANAEPPLWSLIDNSYSNVSPCYTSFLLQSTFAMLNWALSETVTKSLFGVEMLPGPGFLAVSFTILGAQYAISILFPSVWTAMSLTGATAAVFVAYILPGALIVKVGGQGAWDRSLGAVCVGLGLLMGAVGVLNTLFLSRG